MAGDKTNLEKLEEQASATFGKPVGVNSTDRSMLEISETNRWTFDPRQSELQIAWDLLTEAVKRTANRDQVLKRVQDDNGNWTSYRVPVTDWDWMELIKTDVWTNQLTMKAFSRMQHLRQTASMASIIEVDEQKGFFQRLFGG